MSVSGRRFRKTVLVCFALITPTLISIAHLDPLAFRSTHITSNSHHTMHTTPITPSSFPLYCTQFITPDLDSGIFETVTIRLRAAFLATLWNPSPAPHSLDKDIAIAKLKDGLEWTSNSLGSWWLDMYGTVGVCLLATRRC
jgi:hypothetical protein